MKNETYIFFEAPSEHYRMTIDALEEILNKKYISLFSQTQGNIRSIWFKLGISWDEADRFVSELNEKYGTKFANFFVENKEDD